MQHKFDVNTAPKYNILEFINTESRAKIIEELNTSSTTFWRKAKATINDNEEFTLFEMVKIAKILKRGVHELISKEAKLFYEFKEL